VRLCGVRCTAASARQNSSRAGVARDTEALEVVVKSIDDGMASNDGALGDATRGQPEIN
jgi:hypothetical protein